MRTDESVLGDDGVDRDGAAAVVHPGDGMMRVEACRGEHHERQNSLHEADDTTRAGPSTHLSRFGVDFPPGNRFSGPLCPAGGSMTRCMTSAVGVLVALGMIATVSAQQPAQGGRGGSGDAAAPRPAPATLVMDVKFQPAVAGKTEQLPFVQGNIANPDIELKQYGSGNQVLTNAGNPAQFIPFSF